MTANKAEIISSSRLLRDRDKSKDREEPETLAKEGSRGPGSANLLGRNAKNSVLWWWWIRGRAVFTRSFGWRFLPIATAAATAVRHRGKGGPVLLPQCPYVLSTPPRVWLVNYRYAPS